MSSLTNINIAEPNSQPSSRTNPDSKPANVITGWTQRDWCGIVFFYVERGRNTYRIHINGTDRNTYNPSTPLEKAAPSASLRASCTGQLGNEAL